MRNFDLEVYFSELEFNARYHMTASDMESMTMQELLDMASADDRDDLSNLWLGYTETWGAPDVRQAVSDNYASMIGSDNILCFAGAGEGIYSVMRVLLDQQDHAIVVVPNYQSAETIPLDICQVSGVRLHYQNDWQLNLDDVKAAMRPNTKLISINFPNNPTGATMSNCDFDAIVELCRKNGIYLFSDEVYRGVEGDISDTMFEVADVYEKVFL